MDVGSRFCTWNSARLRHASSFLWNLKQREEALGPRGSLSGQVDAWYVPVLSSGPLAECHCRTSQPSLLAHVVLSFRHTFILQRLSHLYLVDSFLQNVEPVTRKGTVLPLASSQSSLSSFYCCFLETGHLHGSPCGKRSLSKLWFRSDGIIDLQNYACPSEVWSICWCLSRSQISTVRAQGIFLVVQVLSDVLSLVEL